MRRWPAVWLAALCAAAALGAEWMRAPGLVLSVGLAALAAVALAAAHKLRREAVAGGWAPLVGAGLALAGAVGSVWATGLLWGIERRWPAVREAVIRGATDRLEAELEGAVSLARSLVEGAAPGLGEPASRAFERLAQLVTPRAPSHGVALLSPDGRPVAWAGVHRLAIPPGGPELELRTTPFYLWLVARRHRAEGTAMAAVLLERSGDVPSVLHALADRFASGTGVDLKFYRPREAPADSDVFDYVLAGGDTLFAVAPLPPEQAATRSQVLSRARRVATALAAAALLVAALGAMRSGLPVPLPALPAAAALAVVARAPLSESFGPGSPFWPGTYQMRLLGPLSASAGALLLSGIVAALLAIALWRRGLRPSAWSWLLALGVTVLAPYLMQDLARGIRPPAGGVDAGLWLTWQAALVIPASALVLFAAALVRGPVTPARTGRRPAIAISIAAGLAALGLWLWEPAGAWPDWYPYLWVPALLLAIRPMPLRGTLPTVAIVSGSAAALLTWGATTEGRIELARRDAEGLGDTPGAAAAALLEHLVREGPAGPPPRAAGDLFRVWRRSALGEQGLPASLALWAADGRRVLALDLAELDLPAGLVAAVAREAWESGEPVLWTALRVPGVYGLAAIPQPNGTTLTVSAGPPSRLVAPTKVGRWLTGGELAGPAAAPPPYDLALSPPDPRGAATSERVTWRRVRWSVRGERVLALPGGARHAHALVDLGGPSALLQRGALVLLLDVMILAALWMVAEGLGGRLLPALRGRWRRAARSLRTRLTVSLALFFLVPSLAFAAWSYRRLGDEVRRARQLLIQRTLRDAGALLRGVSPDDTLALRDASRRVDAELFLTSGGRLVAASAPVLDDLGLVDRLVPADAFERLVYGDEIELSLRQEPGLLVGYRVLARGDPATATVLAAPEFLDDVTLRRREGDLGIAVLVASAAGVLAALLLSAVAARALARPVQRLREAALALGAGEYQATTGEHEAAGPGALPVELEPVHAAIAQAAADVEAAQRAQRVLAWGEMARQVAHEVKNPLTPIRLGIQHLLRLSRERPVELPAALPGTSERILSEIERLDAIARAFSRFAAPAETGVPLERVDLGAVAHQVHDLYRVGEGPPVWLLEAEPGVTGLARRDELVEVLVNLCENARNAAARRVVLRVRAAEAGPVVEVSDDGNGIPADVLPRVFEPRFSTTTSGSGMGLAIARRLVESWGGGIAISSVAGQGTTVTVRLSPAARP
jgi:signal transduction histidine kinase